MNRKTHVSTFALVVSMGFALSFSAAADESAADIINSCERTSMSPQEEIQCLRQGIRNLLSGGSRQSAVANEPLANSASSMSAESATPTGIGAEQVMTRNSRSNDAAQLGVQQSNNLRVADSSLTADNRLVLVLENGHVWVQSKGDGQIISLRKGEDLTVSIRRGAISGYRVQLHELNRVIVAERFR